MADSKWLPKDYKRPETPSNYMKLEDGQNKLRIMSEPVMGFLYWNRDNKPVRVTMNERPEGRPEDMRDDDKIKHFWALIVWNYAEKRLQILELTQASIQGPIEDLAANADWGDPREYDITITKTGQKLDTEYSVMPSPARPVPDEARQAFSVTKIDLEQLFSGGDPFNPVASVDSDKEIESGKPKDFA